MSLHMVKKYQSYGFSLIIKLMRQVAVSIINVQDLILYLQYETICEGTNFQYQNSSRGALYHENI